MIKFCTEGLVLDVGNSSKVGQRKIKRIVISKFTYRPIFSGSVSLFAEQNDLWYAVPDALFGVGTKVDPKLCRADRSLTHVLREDSSFTQHLYVYIF